MEQLPDTIKKVLVLKGNVNVYITPDEEKMIEVFLETGQHFVRIQDRLITKEAILYIVPALEIEEAHYLKRGYWKCPKGHWMPREAKKCEEAFEINGACYL